jgi:hypothetical protein
MNDTASPLTLNAVRGKLGLLTAQYVLPIWQRITPIWTYSEEEIEKWNLSVEDLEQFRNLPNDSMSNAAPRAHRGREDGRFAAALRSRNPLSGR